MKRLSPPMHFGRRGVATIEFAIMLSLVLVPLTFGVTELGRAAYQYNTMTKMVRDAARHLSEVTPGTSTLAVKCLAITGVATNNGTTCSGSVLIPGLTVGHVTVCDRVTCPNTCNLIPVVVNGTTRGTVHLATVSIGPPGTAVAFASLVSAIVPSFSFGAISATFAVKA